MPLATSNMNTRPMAATLRRSAIPVPIKVRSVSRKKTDIVLPSTNSVPVPALQKSAITNTAAVQSKGKPAVATTPYCHKVGNIVSELPTKSAMLNSPGQSPVTPRESQTLSFRATQSATHALSVRAAISSRSEHEAHQQARIAHQTRQERASRDINKVREVRDARLARTSGSPPETCSPLQIRTDPARSGAFGLSNSSRPTKHGSLPSSDGTNQMLPRRSSHTVSSTGSPSKSGSPETNILESRTRTPCDVDFHQSSHTTNNISQSFFHSRQTDSISSLNREQFSPISHKPGRPTSPAFVLTEETPRSHNIPGSPLESLATRTAASVRVALMTRQQGCAAKKSDKSSPFAGDTKTVPHTRKSLTHVKRAVSGKFQFGLEHKSCTGIHPKSTRIDYTIKT